MGVCTSGDFQLYLQNEEDADYMIDQIENIALNVQKEGKPLPYFSMPGPRLDGNTIYCDVYSDRVQNGRFQIESLIELIKLKVKEGKIKPPLDFQAELLVQDTGWNLDEEDFKI